MKGLFWNAHGNAGAEDVVAELVRDYSLDVVVLAEFDESAKVLAALESAGIGGFTSEPLSSRLRLVHRGKVVRRAYDDEVMSIRGIVLDENPELLLGMVHLPSKLRYSREDQAALCPTYVDEIRIVERRAKHTRTLVIGDFNMNPFEVGMVQATGFMASPVARWLRVPPERFSGAGMTSSTIRCGSSLGMQGAGRQEPGGGKSRARWPTSGTCSTRSWCARSSCRTSMIQRSGW